MARAKKETNVTEEVKKTTATRTKKAVEKKEDVREEEQVVRVEQEATAVADKAIPEEEVKTVDKRDIEIENLKTQIEQMRKLMAAQSAQPQTIVVTQDNSERVWFLWLAEVADDNQILIGENGQYGRIVGKTGTFYVPKNDLSRIMDSPMRYYLQNRWMIVVSGLTDEEREALGVNYKDGEILDEKAFRRIADMGEELLDIFPALCDSHKEMVASRYHEAYMNNKRIDRRMVVKLNNIYPSEAFKDIIDDMNAKDLEGK